LTDNGNGTYTATFATGTLGANEIEAELGTARVASLPAKIDVIAT
jgi:hypothetical protein